MDHKTFNHSDEDSVSPLRSFCSSTIPPPSPSRHTAVAKHDFERLASNVLRKATSESSEHFQSRRFAPSPLDTIPSSLYTRFPRFSTATENSTPDLSAEEMTSTRLSIDEHDILQAPHAAATSSEADGKRRKLNATLRKAISTPSFSLRLVRAKLRQAPSTLSGNTLKQEALSSLEQQPGCKADQVSGTNVTSASCSTYKPAELSLQENETLRFKQSSKEIFARTYSRLSALAERKTECGLPIYRPQQRPVLDEPTKPFQPLSSGALKAFDDLMDSLTSSSHSYATVPDHLLRQNSGFFSGPSLTVPDPFLPKSTSFRKILPGSIDELRSNSFLATSQRVFSFSGVSLERSSQADLDQTSSLAPVVRPVTLCDAEDVRSLSQLRQDPLFVDMPNGHQTNFIFPPSAEERNTSGVPHSLPSLKTRSYRNLRQARTTPLLIRSTSIKQGLERGNYQQKVPLYTPSHIVKPRGPPTSFPRRISSLARADLGLQTWNDMNDEILTASDQSSTHRLSKASEWSTKEDRAHGQDSDHPSLRSSDPSIKSGDLGPWWEGQRFLAVFKKVVPGLPALDTIKGSEIACKSETETDKCRDPFKRTCEFIGRRLKQKLWGTHMHDAAEKIEGRDDRQ